MTAESKAPQKTIGYLEKRGKPKFMNSWKKYWFVLEGRLLLYYGSKDDYDSLSPCKGSINLGPTCTVIPYSAAPLGFQITTRSTTVTLRAETVAEQTKWMQAFLSTLNHNQNTNKSPTKLNHFRYSSESLNVLADNKEDYSTTPASSPSCNSPQQTPKSKEAPLIDRLQKLGARSYGNNFSVQNQILEGVRNSRQRSFGKEMEIGRKYDTNKTQEGKIPSTAKKEKVVLEDEDFCVCTLGKETDEPEEPNNDEQMDDEDDPKNNLYSEIEKGMQINQRERTKLENNENVKTVREFHLHENPNVGLSLDNSDNSKSTGAELIMDQKLRNMKNLFLEFEDKLSTGHDCNKEQTGKNIDNVYTESNTRSPKSSETKNKALNKLSHERIKMTRDLKTRGDSSVKSQYEIQAPTHAEPQEERNLKNILNVHTEHQDVTTTSSEKKNYSESKIVIANSSFSEQQRKNPPNTELGLTNTDVKFHLHPATKVESSLESTLERRKAMYAKPLTEKKVKDIHNSHTEPKVVTPTSKDKRHHPSLSVEHQLEKPHNTEPRLKDTDLRIGLHPEPKNESSARNNHEIQAAMYAEPLKERKLKKVLNVHTEPEDSTPASNEKRNYAESNRVINNSNSSLEHQVEKPKQTNSDVTFHLYEEIGDESSLKTNCANSVPTYGEPSKERKLKNIHTEPKNKISTMEKGISYTELNEAIKSPNWLNIGEKIHNNKTTKTISDFNFNSHGKPTKEPSRKNHFEITSKTNVEPYKGEKLIPVENIYTEPDDEPSNYENKIDQILKKPSTIDLIKIKTDPKFLFFRKSETLEHRNSSSPVYAEPTNERNLKNIQTSPTERFCSDFITDNELYAEPNTISVSSAVRPVENIKSSIRTEELQCEMELSEEATGEFECDNEIYGSPRNLRSTPTGRSSASEGLCKAHNEAFSSSWKREFQFPPPPTYEEPDVYAEPRFSVAENDDELFVKHKNTNQVETQEAEFEMDNELYGKTNAQNNKFEYPEYEEPGIICDNDLYAEPNIEHSEARSTETPDEVKFSSIEEVDEKTGHLYSTPFETKVPDSNFYEDPDTLQVKNKIKETIPTIKKKNRRQISEPWSKNFKLEGLKKTDGFIQKFLKQATWKHSNRSTKHNESSPDEDVDDYLVRLAEMQQLLEKKKEMIRAMTMQSRNLETAKINSRSESADSDKKGRAKSYPSRSPDLLKDLNEHLHNKSAFLGLEDDYLTVLDVKKNEDFYCEVVQESHSNELSDLFQEILRRNKQGSRGAVNTSPETIDSKVKRIEGKNKN